MKVNYSPSTKTVEYGKPFYVRLNSDNSVEYKLSGSEWEYASQVITW